MLVYFLVNPVFLRKTHMLLLIFLPNIENYYWSLFLFLAACNCNRNRSKVYQLKPPANWTSSNFYLIFLAALAFETWDLSDIWSEWQKDKKLLQCFVCQKMWGPYLRFTGRTFGYMQTFLGRCSAFGYTQYMSAASAACVHWKSDPSTRTESPIRSLLLTTERHIVLERTPKWA